MGSQLNLVESDLDREERRVFPRFPFCSLTFRCSDGGPTFGVIDISFTGMQLELKSGEHRHSRGDEIAGEVHWHGSSLEIKGNVVWARDQRIGVKFSSCDKFSKNVQNFLSVDNLIKGMRPLHLGKLPVEMPNNLRYWLQADGPVGIFVWTHTDGGISRFQVIAMDKFIEWEDGFGIKLGRVLNQRNLERPAGAESELTFKIVTGEEVDCLKFALELVEQVPQSYLPFEVSQFLIRKIGEGHNVANSIAG